MALGTVLLFLSLPNSPAAQCSSGPPPPPPPPPKPGGPGFDGGNRGGGLGTPPSTGQPPRPGAPPRGNPPNPGTPGVGPSAPGTGSPYIPAPRGPSSRSELKIDWAYPVVGFGAPEDADRTTATPASGPLPLAQALQAIRGDDPRPLLVLRECHVCNGTDDALLTRQADNERTLLLTRWFKCVKLPPAVIQETHPLHALFAGEKPGHLFVAQRDGSARIDLEGDRSRSKLWKAMHQALAVAYKDVAQRGPKKPLSQLSKVLDELDSLDAAVVLAKRRFEDEEEDSGPVSRKTQGLRAEYEELEAKRSALVARVGVVSKLVLRTDEERAALLAKRPGAAASR